MDFGKYKYEAAQKAKESRRKTSNVAIKEMKYRPKISGGDFDTKTRKVEQFLADGHKVKVTLTFRGREVHHPELGKKILDKVEDAVKHLGGSRSPQHRRPEHDDGARPRQAGTGRQQKARSGSRQDRRRRPGRAQRAAAPRPAAGDTRGEAPSGRRRPAEA